MVNVITRLVSAWQLVLKRGLAHWRLLSSVIFGVLLASVIMSGTVIYFDALRELALRNAFSKRTTTDLDMLVKSDRGPTTVAEYQKVLRVTSEEIDTRIAWFLRDRIQAHKTSTFFLTTPGNEAQAGNDNARSYFAVVPRLQQHITLLPGGRWPREEALSEPGQPLVLEAIAPAEAASLFGVGVGDRLSVVPYWTDATPYASVVISGLFQRNDPGAEFWYLDDGILKSSTGESFRTIPFYVSEKTFFSVLGTSFRNMTSTYAWLLAVDTGKINARNTTRARADIEAMKTRLGSTLFSYRQITELDRVLAEYDRRLFFTKVPMFVVMVLITAVILYYVVTLSSLLVEQQRGEIALLRSRGASSAQVLAVFVLEGATIAVLATVAGPLLASAAISILGYTPAFADLSGSARLDATISAGAYMMSALGGLLSFGALMVPAVHASHIGATRHRQLSARPPRQPAFQRYYLDVLLLVVSILLFRQLIEQGSVVATQVFGDVAVNQLLLAVPALMLVAAAMVLLRLFPLVMDIASRAFSRWLPAGLVMGVWQMARNPTHYARLSLLLILTAGLGIFAASFGGTLERSFRERVFYATGSEIRVEGVALNSRGPTMPLVESYKDLPGVETASPALRSVGHDLSRLLGEDYTMLAVDRETFADVAWFRGDFTDKPVRELLESINHTTPPQGLALPDDATTIGVRVKPDRVHPSVMVTARLRDSNDRYFTYFLGTLESPDWQVLEASLVRGGFGQRAPLQPVRPLTLVSVSVHEVNGRGRLRAGAVSLDDIHVRRANGETQLIEAFDDSSNWNLLKVTPEAISDNLDGSTSTSSGGPGHVTFIWSEGSPLTSRGIFHGPPIQPIPVLASKSFLKETGHGLGEELEVSVSGHRVPVKLMDTINLFPTLDTINERFLIADVTSLVKYTNLDATSSELRPNEVWISTAANGPDRQQLVERLRDSVPFSSRIVHDRVQEMADSQVDPLVEAGWRALLFMAFSSVLLLSGLGFLVHAYVSFREREVQFALMRTIGFSMKQLTMLVWLEQALVIAAGLALGTWMGGRLGAIIMPFLGHDDRGSEVLPPFILEVNWNTLAITYAIMSLVFAVIILGVIWFIRRISLQRVLRLGEM